MTHISQWPALRALPLALVVLSGDAVAARAQDARPLVDFSCDFDTTSKMEQLVDGTIGSSVVFVDYTALDVNPEQLFSPLPQYPTAARRQGFEADVVVQGILETDGFVRLAAVVDAGVRQDPRLRWQLDQRWREDRSRVIPLSLGEAQHLFEQSALTFLVSSQFKPGVLDGEPVRVLICLPVMFRLGARRN